MIDGEGVRKGIYIDSHTGEYPSYTYYSITLFGFSVINGNNGGLVNHYGSLSISNCIIKDNIGGGVIYDNQDFYYVGTVSISNSIITNNTGNIGAGVYSLKSKLIINESEISFNTSSGNGGGLASYGDVQINKCRFKSNTSGGSGGGLYLSYSKYASSVNITNSIIEYNLAVQNGGGVYDGSAGGSCGYGTLTNCIFLKNEAKNGGAYHEQYFGVRILNCDFIRNSATQKGGSLLFSNEDPSYCVSSVLNSIFHENGENDIYGIHDISYCLTRYSGEGNIDADPLFVDPDNGDYHLSSSSPCIDAGTNNVSNLPETDLDGNPRIKNGIVDMGAYEANIGIYQYNLSVSKAGNGAGTVISNPSGIDCGSDCSEMYPIDTQVTLTATPDASSIFSGWSGGGCSGTGDCTVTVSQEMTVTATFTAKTYSISGMVKKFDGSAFPGVVISLTGGSSASVVTDNAGAYSFSGLLNGTYTLTPYKAGYSFTPASITVSTNNADVTGQDFIEVTTPEPFLTVISPNGGETFRRRSTITISWDYAGIDSAVKIELLKNGAPLRVIADDVPIGQNGTGSYQWKIRARHGEYQVRITAGEYSDTSDAAFLIVR